MKLSSERRAEEDARCYISGGEFCALFSAKMTEFYHLAFLLTVDPRLTEECFIAALDDCMSANSVLSEWAHTWARRAIVKNAVRIVNNCALYEAGSETDRGLCRKIPDAAELSRPEFDAVLALPAFERFVFVLSVLERFPDGEVSSLLTRSVKEVHEARMRALLEVGAPSRRKRELAADHQEPRSAPALR